MNRSASRRPVRCGALLRTALLVMSLTPGSWAAGAPAVETPAAAAQVEAVLTTVAADTVLAQAPRVVELLLQAYGLDSLPARLQTRLRSEVLADFETLGLVDDWRESLGRLPAATLEAAVRQWRQPAAQQLRRARQSPAGAEEWQVLRDYRARLRTHPPPAVRATVIAQVVDSGIEVKLSALLQTGLERMLLRRAVEAGISVSRPADAEWPWLLAQRIAAQRKAQIEYSFFSYRYLSNEVLEAYLLLVEHEAVLQVRELLVQKARDRLMEGGAAAG